MAKSAVFGVMHVGTAFSVTYALTGSLSVAGIVTFVEPLVNTVLHYFFDKYWDHPRAKRLRSAVAHVAAQTRATTPRSERPASQPAL